MHDRYVHIHVMFMFGLLEAFLSIRSRGKPKHRRKSVLIAQRCATDPSKKGNKTLTLKWSGLKVETFCCVFLSIVKWVENGTMYLFLYTTVPFYCVCCTRHVGPTCTFICFFVIVQCCLWELKSTNSLFGMKCIVRLCTPTAVGTFFSTLWPC